MVRFSFCLALAGASLLAASLPADAQTLGTFRWRMSPYCNVLVLTVTQEAAGYRLVGYDDDCDAARRGPVSGTAVLNPDGTVSLGAFILAAATPTIVIASINTSTFGGTWTDLEGRSGTLVFGVTGPQPGPRRPGPSADGEGEDALAGPSR